MSRNSFLEQLQSLRKALLFICCIGELGITPIEVHIKSRMVGFWISLVNRENTELSKLIYKIMLNESNQGNRFKWIDHIKEILISAGKAELFNQNVINNPRATKGKITTTLHYLFIQEWNANITQSSKGKNYHIFKENTELESYLKLLPKKLYIPIIKFRTSNHKVPVETGRWENIPYGERKCY